MNHFVRNAFNCPHHLLRSRTVVVIVQLAQTLNSCLSTGQLVLPLVVNSNGRLSYKYYYFVLNENLEEKLDGEADEADSLSALSRLFHTMDSCMEILMFWLSVFVDSVLGKLKARRKEPRDEPGDPKLYLQEALLERKLPELDMRQLVDLPQGLDYNEWLASHTLALFDHVNLLYGTVSEFCTAVSCPDMTGPGGRTYAWYDDRGKKSRVAAPQYVDYVMTFTQKTVNDESVFPTKYANEFPAQFEGVVRRVLRLLFHVVAHMYAAHFRELAVLRLHAHLHLTFAHLTALDQRFSLLEQKETEVLRDLEVALRLTETAGPGGGGVDIGDEQSPRRSPVVTQPLATA